MSIKVRSVLIGVLFILAAITAVFGLVLYDPILNGSDYLTTGAKHENEVILGAVLELILVAAVIGTATAMFPILRKYDETIALWHVCFRFMEAVIIAVGVISVLALLTLSREIAAGGGTEAASFQTSGTLLKAIHDWTFILGPNFMLGLNTIMYSYIFYRTRLVPQFISILGITGSLLVFIAALCEMFGVFSQLSVWGGLLSLPVAANEMILAVWLIMKGFNESALTSISGKSIATEISEDSPF